MKLNLDTKIIGKEFLHFQALGSTNDHAYHLLSNSNPKEGTAILADYQSSGKGQYGRIWGSQPSQNILTSVIVSPKSLKIASIHMLNVLLSISICQVLTDYKIKSVHIKWPNDVYVAEAKIAGLLIQNILHGNLIKNSILGFGLNVNQLDLESLGQQATSMRKILNRKITRSILITKIYRKMDQYYSYLNQGKHIEMLDIYNSYFMVNQNYIFQKDGQFISLIALQLNGELFAINKNGEGLTVKPSELIKNV